MSCGEAKPNVFQWKPMIWKSPQLVAWMAARSSSAEASSNCAHASSFVFAATDGVHCWREMCGWLSLKR
jgi:hypothetical protein